MAGKEVKIGKKIIGEDTKISLSIKTALWIIGGVIVLFSTLFSLAYFDIKKDVKNYKEQADKDKIEYFNKVDDKFKKEVENMYKNNTDIIKDIGDIKGNIKVILDRTSGVRIMISPTDNTSTPAPVPTQVK